MVVVFKRRPIQIPYQKMIRYKVFQMLAICKIFQSLKLIKLQIIFYILDNCLDIDSLEKDLEDNKFLITSFNPDVVKTIDYCFGFNYISFSSKSFKLTEDGDKFLEKILIEKIFINEIKKIKKLKSKNSCLNKYITSIK